MSSTKGKSRWYVSKSGMEARRVHLTLAFTREDWERLQAQAKATGQKPQAMLEGWALDAFYSEEHDPEPEEQQ